MNNKLIEALNFLNALSEEDIKNQFEKSFKKFENISKEVNMRKKIKENQKFKIYVRNRDTNEREFRGIVKIVNIKGDRIYLKRDKYFL